ncbi:MAG: FAD-dependent oxidoreductase [Proteobacteria bacterium]|nr:FAD-dependent oxidoreductase [Pseudomonadota bacterium]MBU4470140.1 FAD-dependent oxidoreductase [Pseudomonadota bacterium]MCG2753123.1 FAD-dependent oxidoreductase [Desulfobacteraceae bacterium]
MRKDPLFEPININKMEVKNRIYMPAMHMNMAHNFLVTDALVDFYIERAKGGTGMIAVGFATIDEQSGGPTNIGAHHDDHLPGLKRLASAIHENGACSVCQINHGGRNIHSFLLGGKPSVAPSPVPCRLTRETPKELTEGEIKQIVSRFAESAARVKNAGFDSVEVLSGTGYLISNFLSPLTNLRKDQYGGSLENRMRFGVEVMTAIRQAVGKDYPVMFRMNGNDLVEGGQGRKELTQYAMALADAGVDALCINVGWHEARIPQIVTSVPRAMFGYMSKGIKEVVSVPVIASHRINDPETAREMIADGLCDMVALGRPLIADPDFAQKAQSGREKEIIHCIACSQGCFDHLGQGKYVECLCNPKAGHEKEAAIAKAPKALKVMVIGGGPAGMSAAAAAAERGHDVTVYEQSARLGGQLYIAAAPPGREEFSHLAEDLGAQLPGKGVKVVLNKTMDVSAIAAEKPDQVILATGGKPIAPKIPGVDKPHVVQAWDVLAGNAQTGKRVAVVGGGAVGVETALLLAEKGTLTGDMVKFLLIHEVEPVEDIRQLALNGTKKVQIFEMMDKIGADIGRTTKWTMLQSMDRHDVKATVGAKVVEITDSGLRVQMGDKTTEVQADSVVLAVGTMPYNPLEAGLTAMGIPCITCGDAQKVAQAFDAVHGGFAAGKNI